MYCAEEQSTAIAYRIIHENLPKFIENIQLYHTIKENHPELDFTPILSEMEELIQGQSLDEIFCLDFFNQVLSQKGIEFINFIIGGKAPEQGRKIKGLNEYINLYNQQQTEKRNRIPKFKQLYKQILSDRSNISFLPDAFETDNELLETIENYYQSQLGAFEAEGTVKNILDEVKKLCVEIPSYDLSKIHLRNDTNLTTISLRIFADHSIISNAINHFYENSYHPLCFNELGRQAMTDHNYPPFVDASCRREPDLQNEFPSITSLCRQEFFAPNLQPNDIIVYMTVKGNWYTDYAHYRLVAILEVQERRESHNLGRDWYNNKGIRHPSNCMVNDSEPLPFDHTAGDFKTQTELRTFLSRPTEKRISIGNRRVQLWNDRYKQRAKDYPVFIITKKIFRDLHNPPILTLAKLESIFGRVPNTRNPNIITKKEFKCLAEEADIDFIYE